LDSDIIYKSNHIHDSLNKVWLLAWAILFFIISCRERQEAVVARVGESPITHSEFLDAYRFNPSIKDIRDDKKAKKQVLLTLIAEKMLADDVRNLKRDERRSIHIQTEQFEREAVIERFWEQEIFSGIELTEKQLIEAYQRSKNTRVVEFLMYETEEEARKAWLWYQTHKNFEDLAALQGIRPEHIPVDTIRFGEMLPRIEEMTFKMKPDSVAGPVMEGKYYFLIRLKNEIRDLSTSREEFLNKRKHLKKQLKRSIALRDFQIYIETHLEGRSFSLDKNAFKDLVKKLEGQQSFGYGSDNLELLNSASDETKSLPEIPIVQFSDGTIWNTNELLQRLAVSPYPIKRNSRREFRVSMIEVTRQIINDELLVRHARDLGLHKSDYVEKQKRIWEDYLLYKSRLKDLIREADSKIILETRVDCNRLYDRHIEDFLLKKLKTCPVEINYHVLDTLQTDRANMAVFKTHFPRRTLYPPLQLIPKLPRWSSNVWNPEEY
jgi:hypothetical protein